MGVEISRQSNLAPNINDDSIRNEIISRWNSDKIKESSLNSSQKHGISTINSFSLDMAGTIMKDVFKDLKEIKVLEVMCGNCVATQLVKKHLQTCKWIATDIVNHEKINLDPNISFHQMNSVQAVKEFGLDSNILLMISPPPFSLRANFENMNEIESVGGYGDYYACKDFIEQCKDTDEKFIVFIGELGASDGSEGMYKYLTRHPNLQSMVKQMIHETIDIFGGSVEKELFIFRICKS